MRCTRCGRKLTRVFYHGGFGYGSECITLFIKSKYGKTVKVREATSDELQPDMFDSEVIHANNQQRTKG